MDVAKAEELMRIFASLELIFFFFKPRPSGRGGGQFWMEGR